MKIYVYPTLDEKTGRLITASDVKVRCPVKSYDPMLAHPVQVIILLYPAHACFDAASQNPLPASPLTHLPERRQQLTLLSASNVDGVILLHAVRLFEGYCFPECA